MIPGIACFGARQIMVLVEKKPVIGLRYGPLSSQYIISACVFSYAGPLSSLNENPWLPHPSPGTQTSIIGRNNTSEKDFFAAFSTLRWRFRSKNFCSPYPGAKRFSVYVPSTPLNRFAALSFLPGTISFSLPPTFSTNSLEPITPESVKYRQRYRNNSTSPRT